MHKNVARRSSTPPLIESLESRRLLSVSLAMTAPFTTTTLIASIHRPKIGQAVTLSVLVRAPARFGKPVGMVEFIDNGNTIDNLDGTPLAVPLSARGRASYSFSAGNIAFYIGQHVLVAQFVSSNSLPASASRATVVTVGQPLVHIASNGLEAAILKHGHGKGVAAGQTATVLYTGFLAATGEIFDYASAHDPATLSYVVGAGEVIPGFDEGTVGMKVGETRVLGIPADLAYGPNQDGSIPPNSNLTFILTLLSIT